MINRRDLTLLATALLAGGCTLATRAAPLPPSAPGPIDGWFTLRDNTRLPYRSWLPAAEPPAAEPWAVMLALHGFNDSRDAFEIAAPVFQQAGIAVFAPDQRGFGDAPGRGGWAGGDVMVADAADMARQLQARFAASRLFLCGESMGGAVLLRLGAMADAPPVAGYVLAAPAVWGRAEMNVVLRGSLWLASRIAPGMALSGSSAGVIASDNRAALIRLSSDPLTLRRTRVATIAGLVSLMDGALAATGNFRAPALLLYGGKDQLVPPHATRAAWRRLPGVADRRVRLAYYPQGYHLLLRDHDRAAPLGDIIAWMHDPKAPLPSGAGAAARAWLTRARLTRDSRPA